MFPRNNRTALIGFGFATLLVFTVGVLILNVTTMDNRWVDIPYAKR